MNSNIPAALDRLKQMISRPDVYYILAAATSTTLGYGNTWLPLIYTHATHSLPPSTRPLKNVSSPLTPFSTLSPRQKVVLRLKETLTKSISIIGVVKPIEAHMALRAVLENNDRVPSNISNYRSHLFRVGETDDTGESKVRGLESLRGVYKGDLDGIFAGFGDELEELESISVHLTYGYYLSPVALPPEPTPQFPTCTKSDPSDTNSNGTHDHNKKPFPCHAPHPHHRSGTLVNPPSAPLTQQETSILTLSCIISQLMPRQVLWHLRGALRVGVSREEVEEWQKGIDFFVRCVLGDERAKGLRSEGGGLGDMPRVGDVGEDEV